MVHQLMPDGKTTVKFDKINIPGRTPRALREHFAAMKNDVQAADIQNKGSAGVAQVRAARGPTSAKKVKAEGKGTKVTTPSKRKSGDDSDEGSMMDVTPTNNKRRKSPIKKQIVKDEEEEAEESEDMPVLHDSSGEDAAPSSPESYHSYDYYD